MPDDWVAQILGGIKLIPIICLCVLAFALRMSANLSRRASIIVPSVVGSAYGVLVGFDAAGPTALSVVNAVLLHGAGATIVGRLVGTGLKKIWGNGNGNGDDEYQPPPRDPGLRGL